jgi:hypothetical protein
VQAQVIKSPDLTIGIIKYASQLEDMADCLFSTTVVGISVLWHGEVCSCLAVETLIGLPRAHAY